MKGDVKFGMLILLITLLVAVNIGATESADSIKSINESVQLPTQFSFSPPPFTEVVPVKDANADELYFRAREWFSRAFKASNNVLQMDSKERMTLIGKGTIEIPPGSTFGPTKDAVGFVHFTIAIYLKDGRYKYEVADAKHETAFRGNKIISAGSLYKSEADGSSVWFGKLNSSAFEYVKTYAAEQLGLLIENLKLDMAKSGSPAKKDNW
jgi:uncharacterized protein with TBP-like fold DUF4468